MALELKVPPLGESVSEAFIGTWLKKDGEAVRKDDVLVQLETDKANVELRADATGTLKIVRRDGAVKVGELIAKIEDGAAAAPAKATPAGAATAAASPGTAPPAAAAVAAVPGAARPAAPVSAAAGGGAGAAPALPVASSAGSAAGGAGVAPGAPGGSTAAQGEGGANGAPRRAEPPLTPAQRRQLREHGIDPASVEAGGGRIGRLLLGEAGAGEPRREAGAAPGAAAAPAAGGATADGERRTPMTRLRKRIAERLLEAQRTAAILTTFNEVDMGAVMETRARWKQTFQEKHGVALGFMSFFARACTLALREMPVVNSEIRGDDIVSRDHVHLGVAVSTDRGLVVPVVRNAHRMGFADLEREIGRLAGLARDQKLSPDDLQGGTFTISNGGVFGSLLSTPILNPPQAAILGMHKIEDRPVVKEAGGKKEIVIRPMMYLALSYDHRLIDGRDSVAFLVKVKERIEDPARLLLEV